MAHEVWAEYYDRLAALIREHRTTLVFVNTRKMAERLARQLADRLGEDAVAAHHGSLSKERRLDAEQRLEDAARCASWSRPRRWSSASTSATSIWSARSDRRGGSRTLLQRVGRAGHTIHGTPKGRIFPETRDDLVECVALLDRGQARRARSLDSRTSTARRARAADRRRGREPRMARRRSVSRWCGGRGRIAICRATDFDAVVRMLADGFTTRRGRRGGLIHRDEVHGRILAKRSARTDRADLGRRHSRRRRLPRRARSRRDVPRHAERRLRDRKQRRRHLSARQQLVAHPAGGRRHGARRRCARRAADDSVLAWRGAGPHARSCRRSSAICASGLEPILLVAAIAMRAIAWLIGANPGCRAHAAEQVVDYLAESLQHPRRAADPATRSSSSASSTIRAACSWCCTRRSAAASTARGRWRCASGSAASSISSCRRRRPKKGCCCRSSDQHAFPLADVFRYLHPSSVRGHPGPGVPRCAGVPDALAMERHRVARGGAHERRHARCRRRCSGCVPTICWRRRFPMPRRASKTFPAIGRFPIIRWSRRRCGIASKRRWICRASSTS